MKKVLIISPYFPPSNAADMHRIRMSLQYFKEFGWLPEVVTIDEKFSDQVKDPLLSQTISKDIKVYKVSAFSKKWTSKFGLGSLGLRSMYFFKKKVDCILRKEHFDLIYFSTTHFPLTILGAYWQKKFHIPYVIDFQDPWFSDYYQHKPKSERPKKHWFSYRLNKYLEPIAMKKVNGLISVSAQYLEELNNRYPWLKDIPSAVITFGYIKNDFEVAALNKENLGGIVKINKKNINIFYIGRGGYDLQPALTQLFRMFKKGMSLNKDLNLIRFYFIGTSYAAENAVKTIEPVAKAEGVAAYVTEITARIGFYETIHLLTQSDGLIIPGSESAAYSASKLYPYILAGKPLLGVFVKDSAPWRIVKECNAGSLVAIDEDPENALATFNIYFDQVRAGRSPDTDWTSFEKYSARALTLKQVQLFNQVVN